MAIKTTVCGVQGHAIDWVIEKETVIPGTQVFVKQYLILCTQCGAPLDEIKKERVTRSGTSQRDRKAKAAAAVQPAETSMEASQ